MSQSPRAESQEYIANIFMNITDQVRKESPLESVRFSGVKWWLSQTLFSIWKPFEYDQN
jgi:hypothetical protein